MKRLTKFAGAVAAATSLLVPLVAVPAAQATPPAVETRNLKGPSKALWQAAGRTTTTLSEGYYVHIERTVDDTTRVQNFGMVNPTGDPQDAAAWWENAEGAVTSAIDGRTGFAGADARSLALDLDIPESQVDATLERAGLAPGDWVPYDVAPATELLAGTVSNAQTDIGAVVRRLMMGVTTVRADKATTGVTEYTLLQRKKPVAFVTVANGIVVAVRTQRLFMELIGVGDMVAPPDTSGVTVVDSDFVQQLFQRLAEDSALRSLATVTSNSTNAAAASGDGVVTMKELREEMLSAFGEGYRFEWERRSVSIFMDSIADAPAMPGVCARVVLEKAKGPLKVVSAVKPCLSQ